MKFWNKILGLKQNANHKVSLGRKVLHKFNNSIGVKYVKGLNQILNQYPLIEQIARNIPVIEYIPRGLRLAGLAVNRAEKLEKTADLFSKTTGFGVSDSGGTVRPTNQNL